MSLRQQICDLLATGKFTARQVADQLGVQSRAEVKKVRDAILELVREGRVEGQIGEVPGGWAKLWRLAGSKNISVQDRLWRACCLKSQKGQFTVAELVPIVQGQKSAAVSIDYAKRFVRWLWEAGYLAIAGRGRAGALLYRVVAGKEKDLPPPWNRRAEKRKRVGQASPPAVPLAAGGTPALPTSPQARLDAALAEFGRAMVEIAGSCRRAQEIIQQMQDEIQAVKEQGHGEPADGHH